MYLKISYSADAVGPTPLNVYVPIKPPLTIGANTACEAVISTANISCDTVKSPLIEADVFTTNPKSGDILAIAEPDCSRDVSNDKLAILILVNPLPSPTNVEPDEIITFPPVTNKLPLTASEPENILTDVFISKPLFGDITASTDPDIILSN